MDNRHPTGDDKENKSVRRAMLERQAAEEQKERLARGDFDNDASPAGKSAAKKAVSKLEGQDVDEHGNPIRKGKTNRRVDLDDDERDTSKLRRENERRQRDAAKLPVAPTKPKKK